MTFLPPRELEARSAMQAVYIDVLGDKVLTELREDGKIYGDLQRLFLRNLDSRKHGGSNEW